jgi:hypothetical protein
MLNSLLISFPVAIMSLGEMENGAELTRALAEDSAQQSDLELITEMALRAEKAAAAFRIQHNEDLVVTFGVSTVLYHK